MKITNALSEDSRIQLYRELARHAALRAIESPNHELHRGYRAIAKRCTFIADAAEFALKRNLVLKQFAANRRKAKGKKRALAIGMHQHAPLTDLHYAKTNI